MSISLKEIPKAYNWTDTAVQCYERKCNCKNCPIIKGLETVKEKNCMVKYFVPKLIEQFGIPQRGINYISHLKIKEIKT